MASSIPASASADLAVVAAVGGGRAARPARAPAHRRAASASSSLLGVVALAAPWLAPHDPTRQSLRARLVAPTLEAADGRAHLLGTDHLGRDVLSRMIYGSRVSLLVGFAAVLVGGLVGSALGLLAGFRGGWVDTAIMTVADAQLAFPFILLAIGIIAVLGPSFATLIVVIGLSGWVSYARILRSQVLGLRSREFVDAVHALGGSVLRIVWKHVRAQRALVAGRHRHPRAGPRHRARGHAVLPGPGDPAAHAVLGRHGAGGARVPGLRLVDLDLPGHPAHGRRPSW